MKLQTEKLQRDNLTGIGRLADIHPIHISRPYAFPSPG
jgi:hypothetical protein